MKIALVSEGYPPMSGGVATSAQRVSQSLASLKNDVIVLTFDNTHDLDVADTCIVEQEGDVTIYKLGPFFLKNPNISPQFSGLSEKHKATLRRRVFNQMKRILEDYKPDIILSFYLLNAGFMAQILGNALHIPVVAGVRGNDIGRNIFDCERFSAVHWTLEHASAIACVNRHLMRRTLTAFPEMSNKTIVTKNGINASKYEKVVCESTLNRQDLLDQYGWEESDLVLSFSGNLREKKGVITLVRALKQANDAGCNVRLLVIGPDLNRPESMMVGDLWKELQDRNIVRITGHLDRASVPAMIYATDVACYPSNEDGMANSLLESMALGKASIATTVFDDVITDGEDGLIIPIDDVDALVHAFKVMHADTASRNNMGKRAKEKVSHEFSCEAEVATYMRLFHVVMEQWHDTH